MYKTRLFAGHVSREVRVALAGPMLHRFNTYTVGSYVQSIVLSAIERNADDRTHTARRCTYDRTHVRRSNARRDVIDRISCDRTQP
jgi:hypothetical protein